MGLLWERFRAKYPRSEEHPTIESVMEFQNVPGVEVQVFRETAPPLRVWFVSENESDLVQVQRDRFIRNWRGPGETYPRYERLRDLFREDYATFLRFLEEEGFAAPVPRQCEVTYVNQIVAGEGWQHHGEAHMVFQACSLPDSTREPEPEPEDFGFAVRYQIREKGASPVGRLHVTVSSAHRKKDQKPLFVMTLTARGMLQGRNTESIDAFFDLGRAWIVKRFAALTTTKMHEIWGRQDA
jgi:uncharacterized protein (TIGR04255 family)